MALYPWRRVDPLAWTPAQPLPASRVALITTAGLYQAGIDEPFEERRGGDVSFRLIPDAIDPASLTIGQTSNAFDRRPLEADRNVAYPIDRLRALVHRGEVGATAPHHLSFNGSITAPRRLVRQSAPAAARLLRDDGVHVALLVPV